MVQLIELVEAHPQHRGIFTRCFLHIVRGERTLAPWELVPFCMRTLRFAEVRQFVIDEAVRHGRDSTWARKCNYWSDILCAYDDQAWEREWGGMWDYYTPTVG